MIESAFYYLPKAALSAIIVAAVVLGPGVEGVEDVFNDRAKQVGTEPTIVSLDILADAYGYTVKAVTGTE